MRRGEVFWAEHPEWGRRPVCVMTRDQVVERLSEVFLVMATTEIRGLPTEVELGREDGLPRTCVFNADQTDTVDKAFLGERITTLSPAKLSELCRALALASGCG